MHQYQEQVQMAEAPLEVGNAFESSAGPSRGLAAGLDQQEEPGEDQEKDWDFGTAPSTPQTQSEDLEVFRIFFELFDHEKIGYIAMPDLLCIMQGYCGQDYHTISSMLQGLYHQSNLSFGGQRRDFHAGPQEDGVHVNNNTPQPEGRGSNLAASALA